MDKKRKRLLVCAGAAVFILFGVSAANRFLVSHPSSLRAVRADVSPLQLGIGNSVTLATSVSGVTGSVNSVASFVSSRSGVMISSDVSSSLQDLETRTLNGRLHRLTPSQVATALLDSLHERLASVTDAQITDWGYNSFRVTPDARNVSYWSPQVLLRKSAPGVKDQPTFIEKAKEYRDASTEEALVYRSKAPDILADSLQERFGELRAALSAWSSPDLSPVQAYILAYSFASDDDLVYSLSQQLDMMQKIENRLFTAHGVARSAAGRLPFGENGYLYSSPVGAFFDDTTVKKLLGRLEAFGQQ
jgi:hypothetical protein